MVRRAIKLLNVPKKKAANARRPGTKKAARASFLQSNENKSDYYDDEDEPRAKKR